jgi:hypothetical protein
MSETVYILCALTSALCAALLLRAHGRSRVRLLLWSGLCFVGLAGNNALLVLDLLFVKDVDLSVWRQLPAVVGVALLLYGLVWEAE